MKRWILLAAVSCLVSLVHAPAAAQAEDRSAAKAHFEAAEAAYRLGNYLEAVNEYEAAYRVMPEPAFLFNIAQSYRQQYTVDKDERHLNKAIALYRTYLREAPRSAKRPVVEEIIAELQAEQERRRQARPPDTGPQGGRLVLQAGPESVGAEVTIDAERAGQLPLATELAPGEHHVRVQAVGYPPWQTRVLITAGKTAELMVHLGQREQPPASSAASTPFYKSWWFWTVAGGLLAGGAGVGIYYATRQESTAFTPTVLDLR